MPLVCIYPSCLVNNLTFRHSILLHLKSGLSLPISQIFFSFTQLGTNVHLYFQQTKKLGQFLKIFSQYLRAKGNQLHFLTTSSMLTTGPAACTGSAGWPYNPPDIYRLAATHYNTTKLAIQSCCTKS